MSKLRWNRNDTGGLTLQKYVPETKYQTSSYNYTKRAYWDSVADVFKAQKGDRYVVHVLTGKQRNYRPTYDQYTAFSLREAMRMAKLLVGMKHGD